MTTEFITFLAAIGAGVVLVALVAFWWINRTPSVERPDAPLPLFGGLTADESATVPSAPRTTAPTPVPTAAPFRPAPVASPMPAPAPAPARPAPLPPVAPAPRPEASPRPRPVIREFVSGLPPQAAPAADGWCLDGTPALAATAPANAAPANAAPAAAAPANAAPANAVMSEAGVPGTMVEGHALRYSVPADGTLQFLPGRLEIGSGLDANREIRFVRVDGPDGIEVTFGRSEGPLYRHIQLRDKTVSRAHARMHFAQGTWHLQNLSQTNPVVYNGVEMPATLEQPLADGDRIEMGEVMFRFRER